MKALSNFQLEAILGTGSLPIMYQDLHKYNTIEELLPEDNSFKIVLLNDRPYSGHWVCVTRNADKYNYFNSYGKSYNQDLYLIPSTIRKILGNYDNYLNDLLKDKNVVYNKLKLQNDKSEICGRYVALFIVMNTKLGYSMKEFLDYLKKHKKEQNVSFDDLIMILTQSFDKRLGKHDEIKLPFNM